MPDNGHGRNLPAKLHFQDTELSIIDRDGVPWLSSTDLASALGCSQPGQIANLYNRHKSEFTAGMSDIIILMKSGNLKTRVRVFNPRACYLIAMLAKTHRAKDFRRWVLDVLEGLSPVPGPKTPDDDLRRQMVAEVAGQVMAAIAPHLPGNVAASGRGDMPRLTAGQALFVIEGRQVIVDTRDAEPKRGERAVVIRVEDGAGPIVVTILGDPPIKTWFDRCKIYDSGVKWLIPVGVVIGRVVWEGDYRG